jgi:hypothetical protein
MRKHKAPFLESRKSPGIVVYEWRRFMSMALLNTPFLATRSPHGGKNPYFFSPAIQTVPDMQVIQNQTNLMLFYH